MVTYMVANVALSPQTVDNGDCLFLCLSSCESTRGHITFVVKQRCIEECLQTVNSSSELANVVLVIERSPVVLSCVLLYSRALSNVNVLA